MSTWPLFWNDGTTVLGGLKSNIVQTDWNLLLFRTAFCFQFSCGNLIYKAIEIRYSDQVQAWQWRYCHQCLAATTKLLFTDFPALSWTGKHMKNTKLNSSQPFNSKSGRGHCTIKWCTLKTSHHVYDQADILYIAVNFLCHLLDRVMHCFTDKQQGIHHNWVVRGPLLISATQSLLLTI